MRLFGTDGARGIAITELTCELAMQIGRAAATVLAKKSNHKAKILIYRGNDIVEIEKEDLVKNQNSIILRFSTENLDVEDRISQFSNLLHYFKQIHFDFESFNVSKRAKSILGITNKNQGTQTGNSNEDL